MRQFFAKLLNRFSTRTQSIISLPPPPPDASQHEFNVPPGFTLIETNYNIQCIPGTVYYVGTIERVLQTPDGELITCSEEKGVTLGCNHEIFSLHEKVTSTGIQLGLGGICVFCAADATKIVSLNLISPQQSQLLARYCSQCRSRCDGCRRTDVCQRHAQKFEDLDGKVLLLCPACLKKADHEKFFKKTLAVMLLPFVDHKRKPPTQSRDSYEY